MNIYPYGEAGKHECAICGGGQWDMDKERFYNHNHHLKLRGMGGGNKDDSRCVSLCFKCHDLLHSYKKDFVKQHGIAKYNLIMENNYDTN